MAIGRRGAREEPTPTRDGTGPGPLGVAHLSGARGGTGGCNLDRFPLGPLPLGNSGTRFDLAVLPGDSNVGDTHRKGFCDPADI